MFATNNSEGCHNSFLVSSAVFSVCLCAAFLITSNVPVTNLLVAPTISSRAQTIVARGTTPIVTRQAMFYPVEDTEVSAPTAIPATPAREASLRFPLLLAVPVAFLAGAISMFRPGASRPAPLASLAIAPLTGSHGSRSTALRAAKEKAVPEGVGERYEVELEKPIGISLARGNDGSTYVSRVPVDPRFEGITPGDKVMRCSASFGPEIWDALNYGQVMFAIKTRSGNVFLELEKRGGDLSIFEKKRSSRFAAERNSGNYGAGTAEVQLKNYMESQEIEKERKAMFTQALGLLRQKKYEETLVVLENIIGMEPANVITDSFELTTDVFRVSHYQMACVYSLMGNTDASLESLREAMNAGYNEYDKIRKDPDLANARKDEEFEALMARFDESVFNTEALSAVKNMLGGLFGGKK